MTTHRNGPIIPSPWGGQRGALKNQDSHLCKAYTPQLMIRDQTCNGGLPPGDPRWETQHQGTHPPSMAITAPSW